MGYFEEEPEVIEEPQEEIEPKKKEMFASWEVGGELYRLKLRTPEILELEKKHRCNLIELLGQDDGLPPLTTMLAVTHAAMKRWHHNIKASNVMDIYEQYIDEGGSQIDFFTNVYSKIFTVSGFFSQKMAKSLTENIEEANDSLQ